MNYEFPLKSPDKIMPEDFGEHGKQVRNFLAWSEGLKLEAVSRPALGGTGEWVFELKGNLGVFEDPTDQSISIAGGIGSTPEEAFVGFLQTIAGRKIMRRNEDGYAVDPNEKPYEAPNRF